MSYRRGLFVFGVLIAASMIFFQPSDGGSPIAFAANQQIGIQNQETDDNQAIQPPYYTANVLTLSSSIMERDYTIYVGLPRGYDADKSYPVVYVLDGDFYAMLVWPISDFLSIDQKMPQVIVVGIGYGSEGLFDAFDLRGEDFDEERFEDYRAFLETELIPKIEQNYSADPENRAIFGHSGTGRFLLNTLFSGSNLFQRYIVVSSGNNAKTKEEEIAYAESNDDLPVNLCLLVGSLEGGQSYIDLYDSLTGRQFPSLKIELEILEDESHISVVPGAITKGLRSVFGR